MGNTAPLGSSRNICSNGLIAINNTRRIISQHRSTCISVHNYKDWNTTVIYSHKVRFPSLHDMKNVANTGLPINKIAFFSSPFIVKYQSFCGFYYTEFSFCFWQMAHIQFEAQLHIIPIIYTLEFQNIYLKKDSNKWQKTPGEVRPVRESPTDYGF